MYSGIEIPSLWSGAVEVRLNAFLDPVRSKTEILEVDFCLEKDAGAVSSVTLLSVQCVLGTGILTQEHE